MAKKIKDFKELEGKSLNDLAMEANKEENKEQEEISEELLDNRDYDKYDYYEVDLKKGSTKNYVIMFFLYVIVVALIIFSIVFYKYKDQFKQESYSKVNNYEIKDEL